MSLQPFRDRREAGRALAQALAAYARRPDVLVLALPRGGVPVAHEVARALAAPMDVFVVRKLGVPGQDEFAMGAIAGGGIQVLHHEVVQALDISDEAIAAAVQREKKELERRERLYRAGRSPVEVRGRKVILVDDGLATGATMQAAVQALRLQQPARIIIAVPVGAPDICERLRMQADELVCVLMPEDFRSVGHWYADFSQTTDEEVCALLAQARGHTAEAPGPRPSDPAVHQE
jgi:predicted phosphoribosyltransferase